jgi:hypothetical protein
MNILISFIWTILLLAASGAASEPLSESFKSRLRQQFGNSRKLIEASDTSIVLEGQYIVVFDPDTVANVTKKATQLFASHQVMFQYDNIAIKGVAIRNATSNLLKKLESDPQVLFIQPVRNIDVEVWK